MHGTSGSGSEYYDNGNAHFSGNGGPSIPLRAGIFAKAGTSREASGASYWGIMELSGNLIDVTVTIGNATGRAFTGLHGNGVLAADGHADVSNWPQVSGYPWTGYGGRGGCARSNSSKTWLRVSDRVCAASLTSATTRDDTHGWHGVRSAP